MPARAMRDPGRAALLAIGAAPEREARQARRVRSQLRPYFADWPLLLTLFFFGLVIRTFVAAYSGPISHDAAAYYLPNSRILVEQGFGAWREMSIYVPPLFSTLVAGIYPVFDNLEFAALSISVVSASLMVFPIYGFARFLYPNQLLLHRFAALIACVHPFSISFGVDAKADAFFTILFTVALWCALRVWKRPAVPIAAAFGLVLGLAYLVRPEALGIAVLLGGGCLYEGWRLWRAREAVAPYARSVVIAGVVSIATLAPSLAVNMVVVHEKIGVWTLSPKAAALQDFDKGLGDPLVMLTEDLSMTRHEQQMSQPGSMESYSLLAHFRERPVDMLSSIGGNLYNYLRLFPPALGTLNCVFFLIGLGFYRRKHRPDGLWSVFTMLAFYGLALSLFYMSRRFWVWLVPFTLPVCAAGAVVAVLFLYRRWRIAPAWVVLVVVLAMVPEGAYGSFRDGDGSWFSSAEKRVGHRVRDRFGSRQLFVSAKGRVAFYADGTNLMLPANELPDIAVYMQKRHARFLCLDIDRMERRRKQLMSDLASDSRFTLVDGEDGGDHRMRVYEFKP